MCLPAPCQCGVYLGLIQPHRHAQLLLGLSASISDQLAMYAMPSSSHSALASFLFACPGDGAVGASVGGGEGVGSSAPVTPVWSSISHASSRAGTFVFFARGIVRLLFFPNGIVPGSSGGRSQGGGYI